MYFLYLDKESELRKTLNGEEHSAQAGLVLELSIISFKPAKLQLPIFVQRYSIIFYS